ncbi:MAG: hypothetical protein Q7S23_05265 [bacterium]|nr:hypothetical protein [bacterium]
MERIIRPVSGCVVALTALRLAAGPATFVSWFLDPGSGAGMTFVSCQRAIGDTSLFLLLSQAKSVLCQKTKAPSE